MLAPNPEMMPPAPMGPMPVPKFHDVTITLKRDYECARVEGVPPEEFGIARNARSIRDANYCYHEIIRAEADLIADGYDEDQIKRLPTYTGITNSETQSRDTVEERTGQSGAQFNKATRQVKITEHYVRMDYERKGKPALYKVVTGGDAEVKILTIDGQDNPCRMDYVPFAAMTPVIITHRFFGRSIADLVMDIQRIKTALVRGMLDNMYAVLMPRPVVSEQGAGESTLDDLLIAQHGRPIRVKGAVNEALAWTQVPDMSQSSMAMVQYWDTTREWRTGVSRQGQGVDPNALQNQVATIANQMFNAAQAKSKLIARIFAETGIKELFLLLHAVIRKHGSKAQTIRLRNQWVQVDPRQWKTRDDMTVKVGLGDGSKQEQLAGAQLLVAAQEKALAAGLVSKRNLYNSAKDLSRLLGHKNADDYFMDPDKPPDPKDPNGGPLPTPPDPKMMEIQAKAEIEKLQAQADVETQNRKITSEMALSQQKFQHEASLAERQFELEARIKLLEAKIKREQHAQAMQKEAFSQECERAKFQMDAQRGERDHELKQAELGIKHAQATELKAHDTTKEVLQEMTKQLGDLVEKVNKKPKK